MSEVYARDKVSQEGLGIGWEARDEAGEGFCLHLQKGETLLKGL